MSPADQVLIRLHRRAAGTLMGNIEWSAEAIARLLADGLVVMDQGTAEPRLTAAGEVAARRLVEPGRAKGGDSARCGRDQSRYEGG